MLQITPAVLATSFEQVVAEIFTFEGLSKRVQIDLCDGVFGLTKTWLPYEEKELPQGFSYEFDLMVVNWELYLKRALLLSGTRFIMHVDTMSREDIANAVAMIREHQGFVGLSVSNDYDIARFAELVNQVAQNYTKVFIQVMGIRHIGAQGQPFDAVVPSRIAYLKTHCKTIEIQVDGSMNPETMTTVNRSGAVCAVVGSYLSRSGDVRKTFEKLKADFM